MFTDVRSKEKFFQFGVKFSRHDNSDVPAADYSGVINTARVNLMNSSFLSMVSKAPRTLSATSGEPRASTQLES